MPAEPDPTEEFDRLDAIQRHRKIVHDDGNSPETRQRSRDALVKLATA